MEPPGKKEARELVLKSSEKEILARQLSLLYRQYFGPSEWAVVPVNLDDIIGFISGKFGNEHPAQMVIGQDNNNHHYVLYLNTTAIPIKNGPGTLEKVNTIASFGRDSINQAIGSLCEGLVSRNFGYNIEQILREVMILNDPALNYSPQPGIYVELTADPAHMELVINSRADNEKSQFCAVQTSGEKKMVRRPVKILEASLTALGQRPYDFRRVKKAILKQKLSGVADSRLPDYDLTENDSYLGGISSEHSEQAVFFLRCLPTFVEGIEKALAASTSFNVEKTIVKLLDIGMCQGVLTACKDEKKYQKGLLKDLRNLVNVIDTELSDAYIKLRSTGREEHRVSANKALTEISLIHEDMCRGVNITTSPIPLPVEKKYVAAGRTDT